MQIYVDADAFPNAVRQILYRAVERLELPLTLVACKPIRQPKLAHVTLEVVDSGPDAADDRIVALVNTGDLVVTADIPLASRVVDAGGVALDPRGTLYTADNVKQRLATRDLLSDLRDTGLVSGGPRALDQKDQQAFANQLDRFLTKQLKAERRGRINPS